jgi:hypothetical protein
MGALLSCVLALPPIRSVDYNFSVDRQARQQLNNLPTNQVSRKELTSLNKTAGSNESQPKITNTIDGVAAIVIFKNPKWFHLRYTQVLHNALVNAPDDWVIQIFLNEPWYKENMAAFHPGFHRFLQNTRVHVTPLPEELLVRGRPKFVPSSKWFWEHVLADKVLLFSGNGAFCGNHKLNGTLETIWDRLDELDFMAAPTVAHGGMGGDGSSHSYRNRKAVLKALEYAVQNNLQVDKGESEYLLDIMQT